VATSTNDIMPAMFRLNTSAIKHQRHLLRAGPLASSRHQGVAEHGVAVLDKEWLILLTSFHVCLSTKPTGLSVQR
jgi:hypothetical protein